MHRTLEHAVADRELHDVESAADGKRLLVLEENLAADTRLEVPGYEIELVSEREVIARLRWQPALTYLRFWPIQSPENPRFEVCIEVVRATPDDPTPELGGVKTRGLRVEYSERDGWRGAMTAQWEPAEP